jgi:hypothetical protein
MSFFSSSCVPLKWRNDAEEWHIFFFYLRLMGPFFILRMTGQWIWSIGGMVTDRDKPKFKEKSFFFFFFLFSSSSFFWCDSPYRSLASSVVHLQISLSSSGLLHPLTFSSNEESLSRGVALPSQTWSSTSRLPWNFTFSSFFGILELPIPTIRPAYCNFFFNLMYFTVTSPSNNS